MPNKTVDRSTPHFCNLPSPRRIPDTGPYVMLSFILFLFVLLYSLYKMPYFSIGKESEKVIISVREKNAK